MHRGIFLFSLASADRQWVSLNIWGALLITLLLRCVLSTAFPMVESLLHALHSHMCRFVSTKLLDDRSAKRRGASWIAYCRRVPVFVGWPLGRSSKAAVA
jgi:hypothetical protein